MQYNKKFISHQYSCFIMLSLHFYHFIKIKWIKFANSREFTGKIKNATISKTKTNKYFVSILVDAEINKLPKIDFN